MLFSENLNQPRSLSQTERAPLAARLRPRSFDEFIGQQHLLDKGKWLRRCIEDDTLQSLIVTGPPGVGKTTLAELIAVTTSSRFVNMSAVTATVADVRKVIREAERDQQSYDSRAIFLFLDEIHRFSKAQQDALLPAVENGVIRLIGATTENPNFSIINPLISRSRVVQLNALSVDEIKTIIQRAITDERAFPNLGISISPGAIDLWANRCEGDARKALGALETAVLSMSSRSAQGELAIDTQEADDAMPYKVLRYGDQEHFDLISAFIKSMRGSDPDAAIYWLAKMLHAGEDLSFILRRIIIFASEDIGNADPRALSVSVDAMHAAQMVGMPEARIVLAQAVTYCATAPKSNASHLAIDQALSEIRNGRTQEVPASLLDAHSGAAKTPASGQGYVSPHEESGRKVQQKYMEIPRRFYVPKESGYESHIKERMENNNEGPPIGAREAEHHG